MAFQKKNVLMSLLRGEDYVPTSEQNIVKYIKGVGNNLHLVETYEGAEFLISMPKKFRNVIYLAKGNCVVIDPIEEGNKVQGEVFCLMDLQRVIHLIDVKLWPHVTSDSELTLSRGEICQFFIRDVEQKRSTDTRDMMNPPSDSEEDSSDSSSVEDSEEEGSGEEAKESSHDPNTSLVSH